MAAESKRFPMAGQGAAGQGAAGKGGRPAVNRPKRAAVEAAYAKVDRADRERARITEYPPHLRAKLAIRDEKLK